MKNIIKMFNKSFLFFGFGFISASKPLNAVEKIDIKTSKKNPNVQVQKSKSNLKSIDINTQNLSTVPNLSESVKSQATAFADFKNRISRINRNHLFYSRLALFIYAVKYGFIIYTISKASNRNSLNATFLDSYRGSILMWKSVRSGFTAPLYVINGVMLAIIFYCWNTENIPVIAMIIALVCMLVVYPAIMSSAMNASTENRNFIDLLPYSVHYLQDILIIFCISIARSQNSQKKINLNVINLQKYDQNLRKTMMEYNNILLEEDKIKAELVL